MKKAIKKVIYTIGSADRSWEDFLFHLKKYGIRVLVDVRRFPTSKYVHFKRENLDTSLVSEDIEYIYMGNEFGGFRKGGYKAYTKTKQYGKALASLEKVAKASPTALMCCERLPSACHRRYIAESMMKLGWKVVDII